VSFCLTINRYSENKPRENYDKNEFRVVGACTGLLAASAVASCDDLPSFVPLAIETVRISFHVGLLVASRAREISRQPTHTSWSTIISAISVEEVKAKIGELTESHVSSPRILSPRADRLGSRIRPETVHQFHWTKYDHHQWTSEYYPSHI
jgi:hypothetical protein